ncbi:MAG: hypothetical protein ABJB85_04670 [Nitrososphaerota archaeon]
MKSLLVYFILFLTLFISALYLSAAKFGDHGLQLVEGQTEGETSDSVHNGSQELISKTSLQEFRSSLSGIVNQSLILTKSYQDEIGKWRSNQYDNSTLISITDSFVPKFVNLVNGAQNMTFPKDYKNIHDALVNSLKSETDSYKHFRNYLVSGNKTEDEISTDLLTNALQYEMIYSEFLSKPLPNSSQMNDTVNYISSVPSGLMSYYDRHLR